MVAHGFARTVPTEISRIFKDLGTPSLQFMFHGVSE
jgi:hypothetical protein